MRRPWLLLAALISTPAYALPPGSSLRTGANHHIGDQSFVEKFGRQPTSKDGERVRMTTHLQHVYDWLAARPPTRPELAGRRKAILDAFASYIAKGTTPRNLDLPWRTPVFIDEEGTICAVGALIESTEGRALPEKIAKLHRYDFIEDIAQAMPEVQKWVADSGFTLEEIQTIQPAYSEPPVEGWRGWDLAKYPPKDGPSKRYGSGNFKHHNMDGEWTVTAGSSVVGRGLMKRGHGEWTSFYPTGEKLAEGPYHANQPDGYWRIFHRSGNLAAEGELSAGMRTGKWRFYYDTPAKTPVAVGRFANDGSVEGTWHHYDGDGKLLARSWTETPAQWDDDSLAMNGGAGSVLDVLPGSDGVHHVIHQGTPGREMEVNEFSLELFEKGKEHLYISKALGVESWFGADGTKLVRGEDGTWSGTSCHWSETRKEMAGEGDVARLDGVLSNDALGRARAKRENKWDGLTDAGPSCHGTVAISRERAQRLEELFASQTKIRAVTPKTLRAFVLDQEDDVENPEPPEAKDPEQADLARLLAGHMAMYIVWPHVDGRFERLYGTLAGRYIKDWVDRTSEDADPSYDPSPRG